MSATNFWFNDSNSGRTAVAGTSSAVDRASASMYVCDETIIRAINVAGVTGRPLLVDGPSGCGKSSLARYVAWFMNWRMLFFPVTSRTQATDLLYIVDQLARLQDAQAKKLRDIGEYIRPGVLWEAFDPEGAKLRKGSKQTESDVSSESLVLPARGAKKGAVVLIDEIDKADPDVPNNLLLPLGSYEFLVPELTIDVVAQTAPFIVLTTNNERKLPPAFLRRCVHLTVPAPDYARLVTVGKSHFGETVSDGLMATVAKLLTDNPSGTRGDGGVSIAEYLDAVRACDSLNIDPQSDDWKWIRSIIFAKQERVAGAR
jgi:MoxR-like ATPase